MWCVRKYPINALVRKHRNSRNRTFLCVFSGFSVFFELCNSMHLCVLFVLFGERFYEGLISIWSSESLVGPIV